MRRAHDRGIPGCAAVVQVNRVLRPIDFRRRVALIDIAEIVNERDSCTVQREAYMRVFTIQPQWRMGRATRFWTSVLSLSPSCKGDRESGIDPALFRSQFSGKSPESLSLSRSLDPGGHRRFCDRSAGCVSFCNSRTLPGQWYVLSRSMASEVITGGT